MTFVALSLVASGSVALAQPNAPPVDHFKCYEVVGSVLAETVILSDEFEPNASTIVGWPFRFCNPVEKHFRGRTTPITNPNGHLKMYVITPAPILNRIVVASNQFGASQVLEVRRPVVLAVPTQKDALPPPVNLDHFKCFEADGAPIANGRVRLADQFHSAVAHVLNPFLFCNAVEKVHGAVTAPILHPRAHLLCYFITKTPLTKFVVAKNQFGVEVSSVSDADLLCVPSTMESVTFE